MSKINKLGQYKELNIQVEKHEVSQEEIDQQVQSIVSQRPTMVDKEEVENGDVVTFDFEGFKDGVAFDGGKAEGYQLEIGSGQFIPGFEEQMVGLKKSEEKDLNLTFPENYGVEDLNGAAVVFHVNVHKIESKKEAELNDAFVASLEVPNMATVEQFKEQIKTNLQNQCEQAYQADIENALFEQLLESCDVEVAEEDVEKAMNQHMQHIQMDLAQQGMQLDQYLQMTGSDEETFRNQLLPGATKQAKLETIIDEIIVVENLSTSDEEVDQQVEMIAAQNQMTKEDVLQRVSAQDLKHDFNRVKATRMIVDTAIINA